jgi:phosphoribosylglycinamide formyltransferase-1
VRIGVLASGGGSNLQALLDAHAAGGLGPGQIVVVGANVPGCGALGRAERAGVATFCLDHKTFPARAAFDDALTAALEAHRVDLIVLAGFMRLLGAAFLDRWKDRVVNIHPALLPAFPGVHAQQQAFDYGVKVAGCTVHFVDAGTDTGPIIAQAVVPVLDDDDAERLRLRILAEEHRLLPAAVRALAEGRVTLTGRRVQVRGGAAPGLPDARLRTVGPVD